MKSNANDNLIRSQACPNCYLCDSPGEPLYQGLEDRLFGTPGKWNFKKCLNSECGLVWLDPMPIEKDIDKAYQGYYTHKGNSANDRDTGLKGLVRSALRAAYTLLLSATFIQRERKRRNVMYLDETAPGRLLDVGCGGGSRLAEMRLLGWEVEGQEVDFRAAEDARQVHGLKVHLGALESGKLSDNTFDAVIMNHVIEHVHDPIRLLGECYRILKPNGILVAVTPNIESLGQRRFGPLWRGLEPPRHLHLFSQKTLIRAAKYAGFRGCESWTTIAKAGFFAVESFNIKCVGPYKMGEPTNLRSGIAAVFYHLWASIIYIVEKNSGEECVLRATKRL